MRAFKTVMLWTIAALLFVQTGAANAGQSATENQLKALTHAVVTEGYYHEGQMNGLAQVMANRAYYYGDASNLRRVAYSSEMRGPINKKTPWVGTEANRFKKTKNYLSKRFAALVRGELIAPKYKTAWHFDMRSHTDWGRYLGKECAPKGCVWFYEARNKTVAKKLNKRYGGGEGIQTARN